MKNEIERKFLIRELPNLDGLVPIRYERYFLSEEDDYEVRIQNKGGVYELERKKFDSGLKSLKEKKEITKEEFEQLKQGAQDGIERESYQLSSTPNISVKVYKGNFDGLVRAEVEFESEEEAKKFIPYPWMGKEITSTPLGRDSKLIGLSKEEFKVLIEPA